MEELQAKQTIFHTVFNEYSLKFESAGITRTTFNSIAIYGTEDMPLFASVDVAKLLGISSHVNTVNSFIENEDFIRNVKVVRVKKNGQSSVKAMLLLTRLGLYRFVYKSSKPVARYFRLFIDTVITKLNKDGVVKLDYSLETTNVKLKAANAELEKLATKYKRSLLKSNGIIDGLVHKNYGYAKAKASVDNFMRCMVEPESYLMTESETKIDRALLSLMTKHIASLYLIPIVHERKIRVRPKPQGSPVLEISDSESDIEICIDRPDNYNIELMSIHDIDMDVLYFLQLGNTTGKRHVPENSLHVIDMKFIDKAHYHELKVKIEPLLHSKKNIYSCSVNQIVWEYERLVINKYLGSFEN
jgi:prophage antirepressor-like protein